LAQNWNPEGPLDVSEAGPSRCLQKTHQESRLRPPLCGNLAPMQYEAKATGYELVKSAAEKRVQELERELMAAKAALAA